ncbi:PREDICTED: suppressor protein SRP40-like isoform X2 [Populus euphratica]|uniref:Suppressor protein SRP40-like isoform X2 n=1 Tax=Populus euphratica TaxID=75702 RepID=A0AAJ6TU83_POPEU|nr:PREDICTED: suppressor protein SRP40-like isoform X2 [Populus euphratica]
MKQENNKDNSKTQTLKPEQKALLLHSIAKYLENTGGFSKTLKKFESEAKFEKDDMGVDSLIDLEEVFFKFLKTSDDTSKKFESNQVQGAGDEVNNSESVEEIITNDTVATEVRSKEKKEKKRNSDSHGQEEQDNVKALKEPADNGAGELPDKKRKDKRKKKSNLESDSQDDNAGHHLAEPVSMEEKSKDLASSKGNKVTDFETDNKPKDKKKKKDKLFDSTIGNGEQHISKSKQGASADSILDNKNIKFEGKKKRKGAVFSENLSAEMLDEGKSNSEKDDSKKLKEDVNDKDNKSSKKRKRLSSEDDATQPADEKAIEESKRRKTESSEELKENVYANGNLEKNGAKSAPQKSMKEKNGSVEPKTVKHFQRVKVDEVVFSDERLKDNSYWAKDGAEDGYGAKAQEVLGQVRGRGFRHEKTKKKRGTYRGGQIDLYSHSIKFNYSDED